MAKHNGKPIPVSDNWVAIEVNGQRIEDRDAMRSALDACPQSEIDAVIIHFAEFRTYMAKWLDCSGDSAVSFGEDGEVIL
jgi:hypothetical protein